MAAPVYILKVREIQAIRGTHVVPRGGGKGERACVGSSVLHLCVIVHADVSCIC